MFVIRFVDVTEETRQVVCVEGKGRGKYPGAIITSHGEEGGVCAFDIITSRGQQRYRLLEGQEGQEMSAAMEAARHLNLI